MSKAEVRYAVQLTEADRSRFESKVDRSGGPTACHPWTAARDFNGYGKFWADGRLRVAHVVAFLMNTGESSLPEDKPCVLHRCDNPPCCNPVHLWCGTKKDNHEDMVAKGRAVYGVGERHGSKTHPEAVPRGQRHGHYTHPELTPKTITDDQICQAHNLRLNGLSQESIGRIVGISQQSVSRILSGTHRKDINGRPVGIHPNYRG